jgi:hypothetical protein
MSFATFFQWTVLAGREEEFLQIWNEGTLLLLEHGSLGSALFRGEDGRFSALARWPDAATRDAAFERVRDHSVFVRMRECLAETNRWDDTTEISNMWRLE